MWDRSKQNFWISIPTKPPTVRDQAGKYICDCPLSVIWDEELMKAICFADNAEQVIAIVAANQPPKEEIEWATELFNKIPFEKHRQN